MSREGQVLGALAAVLAVGAGLAALRDATLSSHHPVDPASRTEVIVSVEQRNAEPGQTEEEMFEALLAYCRLEVSSDPVGPVADLGGGRFRAVLRPSLDASNRRQLRGCLEDWTLDQLRVDVLQLADV